ncbi:NADPH-dependent conjugated polyketone reductase C1 [Mycena sanguinolenta]|uniref:NADPH-dependent conjugated polyketone reductase C1 n=1 Tax=Mycena sanguinolenta TaxID=230812 RepID=A0A8H6YSM4_9AGAR|nr:NADPH-dependent conjugated polyketone reductase C1 [Mycena sanguinolenta]
MPFGTKTLNDGKKIPAIAFGTGSRYKMMDVTRFVEQAIDVGFTHIDTAQCALRDRGRVVLRVLSASTNSSHTQSSSERQSRSAVWRGLRCMSPRNRTGPEGRCTKTLRIVCPKCLGLKFVDLYLIHNPRFFNDLDSVWREFEAIQEAGLAKSIGIEFHPYNWAQNKEMVEWSTEQGILTAGYSSLTSITKYPGGPVDAPVAAAAARHGISPTQVLLLWARAKGVVIVTTTSNKGRLEEYLATGDLPPLSPEEVAAIDEAGAQGPPTTVWSRLADSGHAAKFALGTAVMRNRGTAKVFALALLCAVGWYGLRAMWTVCEHVRS